MLGDDVDVSDGHGWLYSFLVLHKVILYFVFLVLSLGLLKQILALLSCFIQRRGQKDLQRKQRAYSVVVDLTGLPQK